VTVGRDGAPAGHINSIQTLGTLDGPGVRFVAFLQGCNLRCSCCHNPETWEYTASKPLSEEHSGTIKLYTSEALARMAERYKSYFGKDGGVTLSGGEPLMQSNFAYAYFTECKARGMNTCLDTSGSIWNSNVEELLTVTDRVLLDIKYHTDELYRKHVGCGIDAPLRFLSELNEKGIPTTLRQVIIPSLNDCRESMDFLRELKEKYACVDDIELLPFRKICKTKYDSMGIQFPFDNMETPSHECMEELQRMLK
jgi:pyruvate formate lyase activating enzyme